MSATVLLGEEKKNMAMQYCMLELKNRESKTRVVRSLAKMDGLEPTERVSASTPKGCSGSEWSPLRSLGSLLFFLESAALSLSLSLCLSLCLSLYQCSRTQKTSRQKAKGETQNAKHNIHSILLRSTLFRFILLCRRVKYFHRYPVRNTEKTTTTTTTRTKTYVLATELGYSTSLRTRSSKRKERRDLHTVPWI